MKHLFTYQLPYKSKEKVTKVQEDGSELSTWEDVEKHIKVIIKEPSRRDSEAAQNIYQETWSDAVRRGILTRAIIDKTYKNSDGFLSSDELKSIDAVIEKIREIREQFVKFKDLKEEELTEDQKLEIKNLTEQFNIAQSELSSLELRAESLYRNSAETIASEKQLLHNILFLSFVEKDGKIEPLVSGGTVQEKLDKFDAILENQSTDEAKQRAILYDTILYRNGKYISYLSQGRILPSQLEEINKQVDEGKITL
jgi:hypothetical protein